MAEPSVEGEVRIGATESFATDHLVPILARFTRAFPKVQLKVRTGPSDQLEPALTTGSIDLRIATSVEADASPPEGDLLTRDTLVWCAAERQDPAMGRSDTSEPVPLVATSAGCVLRQVSETALSRAGIPWALVFEGGSQAAVQSAVGAGLGIAVLPKTSLVAGLHKIAPADALPPLPVAATYLAMRPGAAPVAQRLRAFMLEVYTGKA
jgi:DNA-binding transcriptional LysR family regulator